MTEKLFEKITLNNKVTVPNRLAIAPLTLFGSNPDGTLSKEESEYLKQRATNIGLYIVGATAVSQEGIAFACQPRALTDKDIPSLTERAKIIKSQGALVINQIHHGGALALKEYSSLSPLAPSEEIANKELEKRGGNTKENKIKEFTDKDIKRIINDFAKATELSIKSGYDGVEIHGANNYLIQQFYSPYTNRRKDEWGGSDDKRMSFPLKVIDAVCKVRDDMKKPNFIIGYRLSPEEPYEGGLTMTETLKLVRVLCKKPLQYIHISQKNFFQNARNGEGAGQERLKLIHNETKGKVALIGVGGLFSEKDFEKALNTGFCEFIGCGRASMLNKDLGTILKEKKGEKFNMEIEPEHPEKYSIPSTLWKFCVAGGDWLPPVKGKAFNKEAE